MRKPRPPPAVTDDVMWLSLQAFKNLVSPQPPQPAHGELEHTHWDRESRTWREHEQAEPEDTAA